MTEAEFAEAVGEALVDQGVTADWSTFEGAGVLTTNAGLVVEHVDDDGNRRTFYLTVVAR